MADKGRLERQRVDTGARLRHMSQSVAFPTGKLHLGGKPRLAGGWVGEARGPPLATQPTLLCRLRERQESPSLIHMPLKVLLAISHSCQMLERSRA